MSGNPRLYLIGLVLYLLGGLSFELNLKLLRREFSESASQVESAPRPSPPAPEQRVVEQRPKEAIAVQTTITPTVSGPAVRPKHRDIMETLELVEIRFYPWHEEQINAEPSAWVLSNSFCDNIQFIGLKAAFQSEKMTQSQAFPVEFRFANEQGTEIFRTEATCSASVGSTSYMLIPKRALPMGIIRRSQQVEVKVTVTAWWHSRKFGRADFVVKKCESEASAPVQKVPLGPGGKPVELNVIESPTRKGRTPLCETSNLGSVDFINETPYWVKLGCTFNGQGVTLDMQPGEFASYKNKPVGIYSVAQTRCSPSNTNRWWNVEHLPMTIVQCETQTIVIR